MHRRLDAKLSARNSRRLERSDSRTRENVLEGNAEPSERRARGERLALAAAGQATFEIGPQAMILGVAMSQQP
jgi:hypothetical protein